MTQLVTVTELAENMSTLLKRFHELDRAPRDSEGAINRNMDSASELLELSEDMICRIPASDAAEAAYQLMIASGFLATAKDDETTPENIRKFLKNAYLATRSALHVLEKDQRKNSAAFYTIKQFHAPDRTFPFDVEMKQAA